ncbi:MAG: hypothetical protein RJA81_2310, partial [Planctomycetota bacterium]
RVLENRRESGAIAFELDGKPLILGHEAATHVIVHDLGPA